jgi:hypothetical protein
LAEGFFKLEETLRLLLPAVTTGTTAALFANLVNAATKTEGDARDAAVAALTSNDLPVAALVIPGHNKVKRLVDNLAPVRALMPDVLPYLDAVVSARTHLNEAVNAADAASVDALVAYLHALPEAVRHSREFVRLFFNEAIDFAKADGDVEALKGVLGTLKSVLRVALSYAEGSTDESRSAVGAYVLFGVQVTIASDEGCDVSFVPAAFEALASPPEGALPVVAPTAFIAWADSKNPEPAGREAAVQAAEAFISKLR